MRTIFQSINSYLFITFLTSVGNITNYLGIRHFPMLNMELRRQVSPK